MSALLRLGRAALLFSVAVACTVDDRNVALNGACVAPPPDGVIADFSAARYYACPAGFCSKELVGTAAVWLGDGAFAGLVYSYAAPDVRIVDLGSTDAPAGDLASGVLVAVIDTGSSPAAAASVIPDGFALRFVDCVDASAYSALTFTIPLQEGLGNCPLRFSAQYVTPGANTFDPPAGPLDEAPASATTLVSPGSTTLSLERSSDLSTALAGMQWEFSIPSDDPLGCSTFFSIDDIRLVKAP